MKHLIAGNWKMNGSFAQARALMSEIVDGLGTDSALQENCDFLVCPAFLHIDTVRQYAGPYAEIGGQDCVAQDDGAYTGDISAAMLRDAGCSYVILGHSERRQYHGEDDATVAAKAVKSHESGLVSIICVGETDEQREAGRAEEIVGAQLDGSLPASANAENTVIAYEPVWAIGTGKTATEADVKAMHGFIRKKLEEKLADFDKVRILYGGSVKPENAGALMSIDNVNGALIGGASLKAESFLGIAREVK